MKVAFGVMVEKLIPVECGRYEMIHHKFMFAGEAYFICHCSVFFCATQIWTSDVPISRISIS